MQVAKSVLIHQIPGKLQTVWHPSARAIVDTWTSYSVTLADFRQAVLIKALVHSKANGGRAWVVDSSKARGAFSQEIQNFIGTDVFPSFMRNGVKYFMTITAESAVTRMTVEQYTAKVGPAGIKLLQGKSVEGALGWLRKQP